jgi:hypothetical protein
VLHDPNDPLTKAGGLSSEQDTAKAKGNNADESDAIASSATLPFHGPELVSVVHNAKRAVDLEDRGQW